MKLLALITAVFSSCVAGFAQSAMNDARGFAVYASYQHIAERVRNPMLSGGIPLPDYPAELQRLGIAGEVEFECDVGTQGEVRNIQEKKTLAPTEDQRRALKESAERALVRWKFLAIEKQPYKYNQPVRIRVKFEFWPHHEIRR